MALRSLHPKPGKEIPFVTFISFLFMFIVSRLFVHFFPFTTITFRGTHIHHFAYGIIILAITNLLSLTLAPSPKNRLRLSIFYGLGLGSAFDEFGMWLEMEDNYWQRSSYDAIVIISLFFLNIIYFSEFWKRWGKRLYKLARIILFLN